MASIKERKRAEGTTAYRTKVVIRIAGMKTSATLDHLVCTKIDPSPVYESKEPHLKRQLTWGQAPLILHRCFDRFSV